MQPAGVLSLPLLTLWAISAPAVAARADQIAYAPPARWVLPPPVQTEGATPPDAPLRIIYTDQQVHISSLGQESFIAYRMKVLKPEALPIGNVSITWDPSAGTAIVHYLRIIREGAIIDVLKEQRFRVLQREEGLEQSILNGRLTAALQAQGLRVGDELEFAATTTQRDPTLADHAFGAAQLPLQGTPGAFRFRLSWADADKLVWRATRDLPQAVPAKANGQTSVTYELRDPGGVIVNDGAPARYNVRRLIEYSDFSGWRDISRRFAPIFDQAAALSPQSPLRQEAKKIATAFAEPTQRVEAALKFVQDQIRYVYVGLDGGNYRPTSTDETWQHRFGDCKAKTVLLLSLLRELGVSAEPVLVNLLGGDGLDARLPSPTVFNHVLIRAKIGENSYWLDGTRLGDRHLDMLPAPTFRWALPITPTGSDIEQVAPTGLKQPQFVAVVDIDARKGFDSAATVRAQHIIRGDEAYTIQTQLLGMSHEDADRSVSSYWRRQMDWVEPDKVGWRFDERHTILTLSLDGTGKSDWEGDSKEGHSLDIIGAGFFAPALLRRPKEQDGSAPWTTEFPRFRCYATSIRLPPAPTGWRWAYYAAPIDRRLGGTAYWRTSGLKQNIVRTVMSSRVEQPEITASDARTLNDAIPGFNNKISRVYEVTRASASQPDPSSVAWPFEDQTDWSGAALLCSAPPAK